jgi:hypothetical protein
MLYISEDRDDTSIDRQSAANPMGYNIRIQTTVYYDGSRAEIGTDYTAFKADIVSC